MTKSPDIKAFSFKTVSSADDLSDIRPALDALTAEIARRSARGPLVVLMGEDHTVPAHKLLRQSLMARFLKTSSPFAYGMERAHDMLAYLMEKTFGQTVPKDLRAQIAVADHKGHRLARVFRAALTPEHTPLTGKNLLAFFLDNGISIRANDAAKIRIDNKWYLDLPPGQNMPVESRDGVALRNRMIVERALTHMKESAAQSYVQDCGMGHLLGHQSQKNVWPYAESLSAMFTQAGVDVLPVYTADFCYVPDKLPEEGAAILASKGLVIEELNTRRFLTGMSAPYMEVQLMEEMSAHSGDEIKIFPVATREEIEQEKERISLEIPHWLQQAGLKP